MSLPYLTFNLVLDPTRKLTFLQAAWMESEVRKAKKQFEKTVIIMLMTSLCWG